MAYTILDGQGELPAIDAPAAFTNTTLGETLSSITNNDKSRVFRVIATISSTAAGQFQVVLDSVGSPLIQVGANAPAQVEFIAWLKNGAVVSITTPAAITGTVTVALQMWAASPGVGAGWI